GYSLNSLRRGVSVQSQDKRSSCGLGLRLLELTQAEITAHETTRNVARGSDFRSREYIFHQDNRTGTKFSAWRKPSHPRYIRRSIVSRLGIRPHARFTSCVYTAFLTIGAAYANHEPAAINFLSPSEVRDVFRGK